MNALGNYRKYLDDLDVNEHPEVIQLEAKLFDLAKDALGTAFPEMAGNPTLYGILRLPKAELNRLWTRAFQQCLEESVEIRREGRDALITFHAVWYHHQNREYMSAVDLDLLSQEMSQATAVITFIDDIFDVLAELSKDGGVFAVPHYPNSTLIDITEKLLRILDWRAHEQLISEKISEVACKNQQFVLAVKHPLTTFHKLLRDPGGIKIYLSHPISTPRAMLRTNQVAEGRAEIAAIQRMAFRLRECAILFEPTTIDELRFEYLPGQQPLPVLGERWPLPGPEPQLLWEGSGSTHPEFGTEWSAKAQAAIEGSKEDKYELEMASSLLAILADGIARHINLRDHKLVDQSDFLVVYRPYYLGRVSSGVEEELTYYSRLSQLGFKKSPCIVLHPPPDEDARAVVAAEGIIRAGAQDTQAAVDLGKLRLSATTQLARLRDGDNLVVGQTIRAIARESGVDLGYESSGSAMRFDPASQVQDSDRHNGQIFRSRILSYLDRLPKDKANVISEDLSADTFADRICGLLAKE